MRGKFALLLLLCLSAVATYAQFKASIQGTVMDSGGAAVANAHVKVVEQTTGLTREATTSDQGFYRIPELPPGKYTVTVDATGFKGVVSNDVVVNAEEPRGLDVTLQVGSVSEQVTVNATVRVYKPKTPMFPERLHLAMSWYFPNSGEIPTNFSA